MYVLIGCILVGNENDGLANYITNRILRIKREGISPLDYFTEIGLQISKTRLVQVQLPYHYAYVVSHYPWSQYQ